MKFIKKQRLFVAKSKPEITVLLLTKNRPIYAQIAIKSLLKQKSRLFKLIVSDISEENILESLILKETTSIEIIYVKRSSILEPNEHHFEALQNIDTNYFMVFHDDDIAYPEMIGLLHDEMKKFPGAVAVAPNGVLFYKEKTLGNFYCDHGATLEINSKRKLAEKYFGLGKGGIAPFPGYMYRIDSLPIVKEIALKSKLGKHTDYLILENILNLGTIRWLRTPLIKYRLHDSNASSKESLRDRLAILSHIKKNHPFILDEYRLIFYVLFLPKIKHINLFNMIFLKKSKTRSFIFKNILKNIFNGNIPNQVISNFARKFYFFNRDIS